MSDVHGLATLIPLALRHYGAITASPRGTAPIWRYPLFGACKSSVTLASLVLTTGLRRRSSMPDSPLTHSPTHPASPGQAVRTPPRGLPCVLGSFTPVRGQ